MTDRGARADGPPRGGQTLLRGLRIVEALADAPEGIGPTELSEQLDLDKATVIRLLKTLEYAGYTHKDPVSRKQRLNGKIFRVAKASSGHLDFRVQVRPFLHSLRDATGETAHLGVLEGDQVMYIDKLESTQSIRIGSAIGQVMPISTTALGKAIANELLGPDQNHLLERLTFHLRTQNSVRNRAEFEKRLAKVDDLGYSIDDEENEQGIVCLAAAIIGPEGVQGAMSISGPSLRMHESLELYSERVMAAARAATESLGGVFRVAGEGALAKE